MGAKNGRKSKSRPRGGHAKSRGRGGWDGGVQDDGVDGAADEDAGWDFYLKSVYVRFGGRATDVALPRCRLALRHAKDSD